MVLAGVFAGLEYMRVRTTRAGLDPIIGLNASIALLVGAFLMSHWFQLLVYDFDVVAERPETLLPWYGGHSSMGGFLGAALVGPLYLRRQGVRVFEYGDHMMFGFVLGWIFGRTGCFFAHDHIGRESDFFLAVAFPGGSRHDLGLYEALLTLGILGLMLYFDRRGKRGRPMWEGFFVLLPILVYAPFRFVMDTLRAEDIAHPDVRWLGFTPGSWGAALLGVLGLLLLALRDKRTRTRSTGNGV